MTLKKVSGLSSSPDVMKRKFHKKRDISRPLWAHDIFNFREALGLTQYEIADRIGINQGKWNGWECGRICPLARQLKAIETAFNVRIEIARDENDQRRFYFHKNQNP